MPILRNILRPILSPLTRAIGAAGGGGGVPVEPFSGTFLDTTGADTFTGRLSYPVAASLSVVDNVASFSSATAVAIDLTAKEDDGSPMWQCFDYFDVDATFSVTSFPAADSLGFLAGWKRSDGVNNHFAAETKAHPASATLLFRRLKLNASPRVNGASATAFTPGADARLLLQRQGDLLSCTQTYNAGASTETLTKVMVYPATSDELPRLLGVPFVRFERGVHALTSLKLSASFPNARFGFVGDSLTQGRFVSVYSEGFPQLIRADHPGDVIVCGAPSATTADWLNGTRSVIRMRPRHVFILLGVNDVASSRPLIDIQADYTTIVSRLSAAGITPVSLTLPPIGNANVPAMNTWIKAQSWGHIDIYPALEGATNQLNPTYGSGDGIHWNAAGNLLVANLVRSYITSAGLT